MKMNEMPHKIFISDFKEPDEGYSILFFGQGEYIKFKPRVALPNRIFY